MRTLAVLPSRFQASRFPGKPLALIAGRPMIQWVFEAAHRARGVDRVLVATDDERIAAAVRGFGGEAVKPCDKFRCAWVEGRRHPLGDPPFDSAQGAVCADTPISQDRLDPEFGPAAEQPAQGQGQRHRARNA